MKYTLVILWTSVAIRLCAQNANGEWKAMKMTRPWTEQSNVLWSVAGQSRTVHAKGNVMRFQISAADAFDVPVVALVDDTTGSVWVGKKADLYVESDSGIVGISLPYSGILIWDRGVINSIHSRETVDDLIARFSKTDPTLLLKIYDPVTDLRPALAPWFFATTSGTSIEGVTKIRNHVIDGGDLQIDLESPGKAHTATVWIDLQKRAVVKTVEDGKSSTTNGVAPL